MKSVFQRCFHGRRHCRIVSSLLSCREILAFYFPLLNCAEMGGSVRGEENSVVSHLLSLDHSQEGYNDGVLKIKAQVVDWAPNHCFL